MLKEIPNFPKYFVDEEGNVYSHKFKTLKRLSLYRGSRNGINAQGYYMVDLSVNNKGFKKLVHRLIAETFLDNPNNLPEVDHIDGNILNNKLSNLQWINRKDNQNKAFKTLSPVRNFRECYLFKGIDLIGEFKSVTAACKYANQHYKMSISSLDKYRKVGEFEIIKKSSTTRG